MLKVRRPSPATLIALVALFVALGGTSYAVTKLPKNSVGAAQIKKNAVTSAKVKNGTLAVADLSKAAQTSLRGQTGPQGAAGAQGPAGPAGPSTPQTIGAGAIGAAQLADGSVTTAKLADPPAWTTLTNTELGSGWSTNQFNNPGQYFKGADDIVHFRGDVTCTMPGCNDIFDTLPAAVRPERNVRTVLYVLNANNANSELAPTELTSIGILGVDDYTFSGQVHVYLDNLSYRAAS